MEVFTSRARKRVYEVVLKFPGIHFREIQRKTDLAIGCLKYNLDVLEGLDAIVSERFGKNLRYFPPTFNGKERKLLGALRLKSTRRILVYLLTHPSAKYSDLAEELGLSLSTISWHLKRLEVLGIVKSQRSGRETNYIIIEREELIRVLNSFREGFLDELVDNFIELWEP